MQNIKSILFLYLTPRQKSQLLGTLKAYNLKFKDLSSLELVDKFMEDEKYYLDISQPHFEFVKDYLEDDKFLNELKKYFDFLKYEEEQKAYFQPYIDKQKELAKQMRKKAQEYKMSKLKPTKKQLYYYDRLVKNHNLEKKDTTTASRLDLKNWITEILNEFS